MQKLKRSSCYCILPFLLLLLSSCAEMNSKFDCPMKAGVSCESLDQVNERVDRGEIGSAKEMAGRSTLQTMSYDPLPQTPCASFGKCSTHPPLREGESVQHIWVAPFEDQSGNYHEDSSIYTVVKEGHWISRPLK